MPLSSEGAARTFRQNVGLAIVLAVVAGSVNAMGFGAFGYRTSHMSGRTAEIGEALASGNDSALKAGLLLLASFVAGAATCALAIEAAVATRRLRYAFALLLESGLLLFVAAAESRGLLPSVGLAAVLCFAMGLQNALVTRISSAVVRTTHVTGIFTDLGMEVAHLVSWLRRRLGEEGGLRGAGKDFIRSTEFARAWLHLAIAVSFLVGAVLGCELVHGHQIRALCVPAGLLTGLAAVDIRLGKHHQRSQSPLPLVAPPPD